MVWALLSVDPWLRQAHLGQGWAIIVLRAAVGVWTLN